MRFERCGQGEAKQEDMTAHAHTLRAMRKYQVFAPPAQCDFAYTAGAAQRSELRRLRRFVQLADYLMVDALQAVRFSRFPLPGSDCPTLVQDTGVFEGLTAGPLRDNTCGFEGL